MKRLSFLLLPLFLFSCAPDSDEAAGDTVDTLAEEEAADLVDTFSVKRPGTLASDEGKTQTAGDEESRQTIEEATTIIRQGEQEVTDKIDMATGVVVNPDVPPSFPGGSDAMDAYIAKKKVYPLVAFQNEIRGTVTVRFVVESDGTIGGITIVRGLGYGCDESAMNLVRGMPKWIPGKKGGANVRCAVTIPVYFG